MQNEDKQKYIKTQRRVFLAITLILLFCAFCALICNISILKISKLRIHLPKIKRFCATIRYSTKCRPAVRATRITSE